MSEDLRIVGVEPHLDPHIPWLPHGRRLERKRDFLRVFREAVDFAIRERVDIFTLPGDVFDVTKPSNSALIFLARELTRLKRAGIHVFAVTGHHDRPKTASIPSVLNLFHEAGLLTLFYRLDRVGGKLLMLRGRDIWVGGLSYNPFLDPGEDPLSAASVEPPTSADLTIFLTHNSIAGLQPYSPEDPILDVSRLEFVDLVIAGHLHNHIFTRIGETRVCYVGTAERLSFNEEDQEKGFTLIEVRSEGVRAEHIPTKARPMRTLRIRIPQSGDLTRLILDKLRELRSREVPEALVRVKLEGMMTLDIHRTYSRRAILSVGNSIFFGVRLDERDVQYAESFEAPRVELESPLGELRQIYKRMLEEASDEEEIDLLNRAYELASRTLSQAGGW